MRYMTHITYNTNTLRKYNRLLCAYIKVKDVPPRRGPYPAVDQAGDDAQIVTKGTNKMFSYLEG